MFEHQWKQEWRKPECKWQVRRTRVAVKSCSVGGDRSYEVTCTGATSCSCERKPPFDRDSDSRAKLGRDQTKSGKIKGNQGLTLASPRVPPRLKLIYLSANQLNTTKQPQVYMKWSYEALHNHASPYEKKYDPSHEKKDTNDIRMVLRGGRSKWCMSMCNVWFAGTKKCHNSTKKDKF